MTAFKYKAFISYPRTQYDTANAVKKSLEIFAKTNLYESKALRIYLDKDNLVPEDDLPKALQSAIQDSEYFILMASPDSVASKWVTKELEFFFTTRQSAANILIVLIEGQITWDDEKKDFAPLLTNALPLLEKRIFNAEPLYLDIREIVKSNNLKLKNALFLDAIASLSAVLQNKPKDQVIGAHLTELQSVYKRQRLALGLRGLLGAALGVVLAFYFQRYFYNYFGPFTQMAVIFGAAGLIASAILGIGIRPVLTCTASFVIISICYLWATVLPLHNNGWDLFVESIIIFAGFRSFAITGLLLEKRQRSCLITAFGMAGILTVIIWLCTRQLFPYNADFKIYQTEWFFTRVKLFLDLFYNEDTINNDNGLFYLIPLSIGYIAGMVLFTIMYTGIPFTEIRTFNQRLTQAFHKKSYYRNRWVWTTAMIVLSIYLAYSHTSYGLKKIILSHLAPVKKDPAFTTDTAGPPPAIDSVFPGDTSILKEFKRNDEYRTLLEQANTQLQNHDTTPALNSLKKAEPILLDLGKGNENTNMIGEFATALFHAGDTGRARHYLDLCFNHVDAYYKKNPTQGSGPAWFSDETAETICDLGYYPKIPIRYISALHILPAALVWLEKNKDTAGINQLLYYDKKGFDKASLWPLSKLAARSGDWDLVFALLRKYPDFFVGSPAYDLACFADSQHNLAVQKRLKTVVDELVVIARKQMEDQAWNKNYDGLSSLVEAYIELGAFDNANRVMQEHNIYLNLISINLRLAEKYISLNKPDEASDAIREAWKEMHREVGRSRIALFCGELKQASMDLAAIKKYRLAIMMADECKDNVKNNYDQEVIDGAFRDILALMKEGK